MKRIIALVAAMALTGIVWAQDADMPLPDDGVPAVTETDSMVVDEAAPVDEDAAPVDEAAPLDRELTPVE